MKVTAKSAALTFMLMLASTAALAISSKTPPQALSNWERRDGGSVVERMSLYRTDDRVNVELSVPGQDVYSSGSGVISGNTFIGSLTSVKTKVARKLRLVFSGSDKNGTVEYITSDMDGSKEWRGNFVRAWHSGLPSDWETLPPEARKRFNK
ncbi:hypothetical protein [Solidesulfovibrio magneticus]|uniref:hypothetical protein n=1 Tax=Solidesulfovibrio magneticus TaxID=184917 RepID=UPI0011D0620D|nr:hypothetical protein [Solidesulfovibrio magneticus]